MLQSSLIETYSPGTKRSSAKWNPTSYRLAQHVENEVNDRAPAGARQLIEAIGLQPGLRFGCGQALHRKAHQCESSTGRGGLAIMLRVAPPSTNSRQREWP